MPFSTFANIPFHVKQDKLCHEDKTIVMISYYQMIGGNFLVWHAILWGSITGSAVLLGALVGMLFTLPKMLTAGIMSFGTGVLIGAASFELMAESYEQGSLMTTSIGFLIGAVVFTLAEFIIASKGGKDRKRSTANPVGHSGLAIFIGTLIDAIPESMMIGISLIEQSQVSILLVIAIFISNFPEGLSSSIGLKKDGYSKGKILSLWAVVLILSGFSSFSGYYFLEDSSQWLLSGIGAFAAGGIIAMVSSTMMPEAFEEGGPITGSIAALGVLVSFYLTKM
jgi:zinc transporter, ZIP family